MGNLHFIGGEKGGVGKSFTARMLTQYFIDHQLPIAGFDTDESHSTFSRFYRDFTTSIHIDDFDSLDHIIEFAETNPNHQIIVDLAAQTFKPLKKWFQDSDVEDIFRSIGYSIYLWHVMDDSADSIFLLDKLIATYPQSELKLIVVLNQGRGRDFAHFEQSPLYQKAIQRGAVFLQLQELQPGLARKIDFNNASFWNAANNENMTLAERRRTRVWLDKHYAQIKACLTPAQPADAHAARPPLQQPDFDAIEVENNEHYV